MLQKVVFLPNSTGIKIYYLFFRVVLNLADIKLKEEIDRRNGEIFVTKNENEFKNYPYMLFVINIMKL